MQFLIPTQNIRWLRFFIPLVIESIRGSEMVGRKISAGNTLQTTVSTADGQVSVCPVCRLTTILRCETNGQRFAYIVPKRNRYGVPVLPNYRRPTGSLHALQLSLRDFHPTYQVLQTVAAGGEIRFETSFWSNLTIAIQYLQGEVGIRSVIMTRFLHHNGILEHHDIARTGSNRIFILYRLRCALTADRVVRIPVT